MKKFRTEIDNVSIAGIPYAIYGVMQSYDLKDWSRGRDVAIKLANVKNLNTGEAKHLEQIVVWFVLKAPIELWAHIDTYRVDMSKCSQSTMHTALKNEFVMEMFNYDITIQSLNELESIRKTKDLVKLKNALPSGFMQRRVCRTSLKTLMYIVSQREKHKKEEWRYITSVFEQVYNIAMDRTKVTPEPKDVLTPDGCVVDIKDTSVLDRISRIEKSLDHDGYIKSPDGEYWTGIFTNSNGSFEIRCFIDSSGTANAQCLDSGSGHFVLAGKVELPECILDDPHPASHITAYMLDKHAIPITKKRRQWIANFKEQLIKYCKNSINNCIEYKVIDEELNYSNTQINLYLSGEQFCSITYPKSLSYISIYNDTNTSNYGSIDKINIHDLISDIDYLACKYLLEKSKHVKYWDGHSHSYNTYENVSNSITSGHVEVDIIKDKMYIYTPHCDGLYTKETELKYNGINELINKTPVNSLFYIETIKPIIGNTMHRKELLKLLDTYFDKVTTIGIPIKFSFDQDDIAIYMSNYRVCTISYKNKCTEMYITSNYSRSHMCQNCIELDTDTIIEHIDMLLLRCILHCSGVAYNLGSGKYNLCFTDNAKSYDNWVVDTCCKEINKQTVLKPTPYKYGACSFLTYKDTYDFLSHIPVHTKIFKMLRALFKTQANHSEKTIEEQKSKSATDSSKMQYDIDSKLKHLKNRLLSNGFEIDDLDDITYKGEDVIEVLDDDNFNIGIEIDGQKFIKENFLKLTSGNIDTMIITRMLKIFGFKFKYNKWYSIKVNGAYHLVDVAKRMFYISTAEGVDDVIMKRQFKLNDLMLFDNMYGYTDNARTN